MIISMINKLNDKISNLYINIRYMYFSIYNERLIYNVVDLKTKMPVVTIIWS